MPSGRYTDIIGRLRPNAMTPGDIVDLDGRVIGTHQGIVHFTVGQRRGIGHRLQRAALCGAARCGERAASWSARARRCGWTASCCATSTGSATARSIARSADGLEIFVRVRSTRAPQPAWLRATDGGYEVELVAGEEGVSPGQACVFYDAPSGQARVLGGGFIQSATAKTYDRLARAARPPLVEAMRG